MGDGLMALFGLSARGDHPCVNAVNAAIGMQQRIPKLNEYLRAHLKVEFHIGVGIHYGLAVVGELGFPLKRQFTAIGDVVNIASRIEGQCRPLGAQLLISDAVRGHLPGSRYQFGATHSVNIAGINDPICVHRVEGTAA